MKQKTRSEVLNYKEYSTVGTPLLILHGLFGSHSNWGIHSNFFSNFFRVIGVDLRNHGASPHHDEQDYEVMAADVYELLDFLDIDCCCMIGHSMGGKVAMQLALDQPRMMDRLIVVDISPVTYPARAGGHLAMIDAMEALELALFKSRDDVDTALLPHIPDQSTRQFMLTNLVRTDSGFKWRLNLRAIKENYDNLRLAPDAKFKFTGKVLFLNGEFSRYIVDDHHAQIQSHFPNAEFETISDAGHWLHAEQPLKFQQAVKNFLKI
ncbi:MAG: alpha/beta fold hydrolase [Gammaproteobacteria bacterium]|nr:alpha/beta fold hydrolase [Gammaproteobacteria bacterium]